MSYRAGTGGLASIGIQDRTPAIVCDTCGNVHDIKMQPPAWFLDGKAPPRWRVKRYAGIRTDRCDACNAKAAK